MSSKQLRRAAGRQELAQIKTLLSNGASINEKSKNGRTALHLAVSALRDNAASLECVQYLLEHGADPNASDVEGWRPLFSAAEWGRERCIRLLLQYKATVAGCKDDQGWTALHYAVSQNVSVAVVKLLLSAGVNTRSTGLSYYGGTPLGLCCKRLENDSNHVAMAAHILLDAGENPRLLQWIPSGLETVLEARSAAKRNAAVVYGILKKRMGIYHDAANLVASAVWDTRQSEEWVVLRI